MQLGLISDTHGWVHPGVLTALNGVAVIVHAGDVGDPEVLEALRAIAPVHAVEGNCDPAGLYPASLDLELEGLRLHVSHGHEVAGGWFLTPEKLVARYACDILVFGHTHRRVTKTVGSTLVINPGATAQNQARPTVVRLDLPSRKVTVVRLAPAAQP